MWNADCPWRSGLDGWVDTGSVDPAGQVLGTGGNNTGPKTVQWERPATELTERGEGNRAALTPFRWKNNKGIEWIISASETKGSFNSSVTQVKEWVPVAYIS